MMKNVYLCAPLGGNVHDNLEKMKRYMRFALYSGVSPLVPHLYALCLDDSDPKEREIGMASGLNLLWFCDELWVFGDIMTAGMRDELQFCKNLNITVRKISEQEVEQKLGGAA